MVERRLGEGHMYEGIGPVAPAVSLWSLDKQPLGYTTSDEASLHRQPLPSSPLGTSWT